MTNAKRSVGAKLINAKLWDVEPTLDSFNTRKILTNRHVLSELLGKWYRSPVAEPNHWLSTWKVCLQQRKGNVHQSCGIYYLLNDIILLQWWYCCWHYTLLQIRKMLPIPREIMYANVLKNPKYRLHDLLRQFSKENIL